MTSLNKIREHRLAYKDFDKWTKPDYTKYDYRFGNHMRLERCEKLSDAKEKPCQSDEMDADK